MPNVVGDRYQITIDRAVREKLGIEPGDLAVERVEDGRLVVEFMPRTHDRSLRGILKRADGSAGPVDAAAEREAAWIARSAEIMESLAASPVRASRRRAKSA